MGCVSAYLTSMSPITLRLREARTARGLTQAKLAQLAGVREATVNRIENHRVTAIDLRVLEKLAAALGIDPALLLKTEPSSRKARKD